MTLESACASSVIGAPTEVHDVFNHVSRSTSNCRVAVWRDLPDSGFSVSKLWHVLCCSDVLEAERDDTLQEGGNLECSPAAPDSKLLAVQRETKEGVPEKNLAFRKLGNAICNASLLQLSIFRVSEMLATNARFVTYRCELLLKHTIL